MGRVKVCADLRAHSLTELEERLRVVNTEALVHFKSDLVDAVLFCECYKILPVIDKNLPLILEDLTEIVRPCAYNPVWILRGLAIARAAGEAVDLMQPSELRCACPYHKPQPAPYSGGSGCRGRRMR